MPATSPARETDILALWDGPRQREAYEWFTVELANLRAGFRCAADNGDLDSAAIIATYGAFVGGVWLGIYEPIAWAEELIEPAREIDHPRLQSPIRDGVAVLAARADSRMLIRYSEAGQAGLKTGHGEVPFGVARLPRRCLFGRRSTRAVRRGGPYPPRRRPRSRCRRQGNICHGAGGPRVIRRGRRRDNRVDRCRRGRPQSVCALIAHCSPMATRSRKPNPSAHSTLFAAAW